MRTTVRLDDYLLRDAKAYAARSGVTLTSVIQDGLRRVLSDDQPVAEQEPYRVPAFSSRSQPGVDLDRNDSLLDAMEG